jgi:hypothetical protein
MAECLHMSDLAHAQVTALCKGRLSLPLDPLLSYYLLTFKLCQTELSEGRIQRKDIYCT